MPIDRDQLLADLILYLPAINLLTDDQMLAIAESIIAQVGDDESNYPEVLCKSLGAIARVNQSKSVDTANLKRDKVGDAELEFHKYGSGNDPWQLYINSLSYLCPVFGYTGLTKGAGMKINPSPKITVNRCTYPSDLSL